MELKKYKLREVCFNITDGEHATVVDDNNGSCFLLSNKNIIDGSIVITESDRKISQDTKNKINKRTKLSKDDVLLSTVGTLGKVAIVKDENPNYEFQRSVGILKPNQEIANSEYLAYYLQRPDIQKKLLMLSKGAIQKCLFIDDLKNLEVSLPNLPTQKRIASVLSSLDHKIALNRQINQNLLVHSSKVATTHHAA